MKREATNGKCPAETTLTVIGGRWKVPILWHLSGGTRRFFELRDRLPGVTPKMLTQQLRESSATASSPGTSTPRCPRRSNTP